MSELEGRGLDRAIAELAFGDTRRCGRCGRRASAHPWDGSIDGSPCLDASPPHFTESLDALQAPEKVLRDAGWRYGSLGSSGRFVQSWLPPDSLISIERTAPTEAAARAAAVYAGLKAWKEANGG